MAHVKVTKHVCDLCGNDGYQEKCMLCGREFCMLCHEHSCFRNDVCKQCAKRDDYKQIFEKFRNDYTRLALKENAEFKKLPVFKPKVCQFCDRAFQKLVSFRHHNEIKKACVDCRDKMKEKPVW